MHAERRGEAAGPDPDLQAQTFPGQHGPNGQKLRLVGGLVPAKPVVVPAAVGFERCAAGHGQRISRKAATKRALSSGKAVVTRM